MVVISGCNLVLTFFCIYLFSTRVWLFSLAIPCIKQVEVLEAVYCIWFLAKSFANFTLLDRCFYIVKTFHSPFVRLEYYVGWYNMKMSISIFHVFTR